LLLYTVSVVQHQAQQLQSFAYYNTLLIMKNLSCTSEKNEFDVRLWSKYTSMELY